MCIRIINRPPHGVVDVGGFTYPILVEAYITRTFISQNEVSLWTICAERKQISRVKESNFNKISIDMMNYLICPMNFNTHFMKTNILQTYDPKQHTYEIQFSG